MKIKLRKLEECDIDGMLEWINDLDIQKNFSDKMERVTEADARDFIRAANKDWHESYNLHLAVSEEEGGYLGTISLKNINFKAANAEYAISLRKQAQGRNIGYLATKEILKIAFTEMQLERVYLNVLSQNEKAIRLYERIGFVYEGEFLKHIYLRGQYMNLKWYRMLRAEYEKSCIRKEEII